MTAPMWPWYVQVFVGLLGFWLLVDGILGARRDQRERERRRKW